MVWKLVFLPKTISKKGVWSESQLYPISSQGSVLCYRRALWTMAARWGKTIQGPKHGRDSAPFSDITRRAELPLYSLHDLIESKKTNYQRIQKVGPDFLFHCIIYVVSIFGNTKYIFDSDLLLNVGILTPDFFCPSKVEKKPALLPWTVQID